MRKPSIFRMTRETPLSLIDDNPFNARVLYDAAVIARLSGDIRANGQLVSVMAVPSARNAKRFTLIDGHYRLRAIAAAGLKTILLDVRESVPDVELFRLSYALNEQRTPHTVLDNALAWNRLLSCGVVSTQTELQAITGKSAATISKTLQMLELPAAVLGIVKQQPSRFTLKLGYALGMISKAGGALQATRLAERALVEDLRPSEVEQTLRWVQAGKVTRKKREVSRKYLVEHDGCVGTIKCSNSGKVVADLLFSEPAQKAWFFEQLKHLVALTT